VRTRPVAMRVMLTVGERKELRQAAKAAAKAASDYVREAALEKARSD
jgi:uncharacterized protein (DUF1778 family)